MRRREKKKRAGNEGEEGREEEEEEERKGRLVSIREGEKGGTSGRRGAGRVAGGGGKARTPTGATFSRSFLRSFVPFFVMTVDETMTYFSGFSLPGCPAAPPFTPSLVLPPFHPPVSPQNTRAPGASWASFHRDSPSHGVFLFRTSRVILRTSLSLNPFLEGDLHVRCVNILAIAAE